MIFFQILDGYLSSGDAKQNKYYINIDFYIENSINNLVQNEMLSDQISITVIYIIL